MTTDEASDWAAAVAVQLRAELAASPLTAIQLAAQVGIDRATLSKYLNGHRDIPIPVFLDIVRELNLDAGRVIDDAKRRRDRSQ
ncbi:MAG: helix-turn-helix transcriptional regulator [Microbacterium ginsengisoli]|uniref:helix-turn-helix domain-containing protein n=1 Tax=Microbacterium TaxID=33882 RepID=UPI0006F9F2D3|nr:MULTISPECIES: helix-turn-helix transcriptional regulator [unclassified Microbacterium]KQR90985.1 hypothetical protein ASF93_08700 [Microbacterium sp. Leaf347]KQS00017.1 hypothetical protein ASG00_11020 [Microbacterium sp. Leaf351]MBN9199720.1 helix-turn-helix transcriptional regulator [Microbacterium ginsengisoli]OJU75246.1 MAG: hypothetical protein BGO15_04255 [Microbacterium sp. 71-23]